MPYIHRHVVCVCVYVSQSKRENHPVPQEGAWEIEWPYIHKDMVCVCVYGERENQPVPQGGGGFSFLPGPHAQLENTKPQGWGGDVQEAEHKTAAVGEGDAAEAEGYPVPQGGGQGEYTMTSITY